MPAGMTGLDRPLTVRLPPAWAETGRQLVRFGFVGVAATAVHSAVALAYLAWFGSGALAANLLGFAIAFFVSLSGNMAWVFPHAERTAGVVARFFALALVTLSVTCAISWMFDLLRYDPVLSLPVVLIAAPCVSYCGNRFWVFAR